MTTTHQDTKRPSFSSLHTTLDSWAWDDDDFDDIDVEERQEKPTQVRKAAPPPQKKRTYQVATYVDDSKDDGVDFVDDDDTEEPQPPAAFRGLSLPQLPENTVRPLLGAAAVIAVLLVGLWLGSGGPADRDAKAAGQLVADSAQQQTPPPTPGSSAPAVATPGEVSTASAAGTIVVSVAGAVAQPGIQTLPAESRVWDAVQRAQPTPEADLTAINLAAKLTDETHIVVPVKGQQPPAAAGVGGGASAEPGKVSYATATLEELTSVPGIGPKTAQAILDFRSTHPTIGDVQDLVAVKGIGPQTVEKIKQGLVP